MTITLDSYRETVIELAADILDEIEDYGGDAYELAHERVDSHEWIIYYAFNDDVIKYASNPDAWEDCYSAQDIGQLVADQGMRQARVSQAFFAMREDVQCEISILADQRGMALY